MAEPKIYPKGIVSFAKNEKAPDFVLGKVIINVDEFAKWISDNSELLTEHDGKKQLKLDLTMSKEGRPSFAVDTWKKDDLPF